MTEATFLPLTTSLAGKVALITGGGVRIGRAIALALAQRGANIAFTHLSCEECAQTADEIADWASRRWRLPSMCASLARPPASSSR